MLRRSLALLFLVLAVGLEPAQADVRVLHLSPDAPNVDVLLGTTEANKTTILSDVAFRGVSPYLPVATGNYFIDVVPTAGGAPVIDVNNLAINGSTFYSVAAVNVLASIEPLVLIDDNTINPTQARLRVVHASPNAPAVDIAVDGLGTVLSNVNFKDASNYLQVPGGSYTIRVLQAGTSNEVFVVPNLQLNAGTVYSAWAVGLLNGTGNQAFGVLPTVDAIPEPTGAAAIAALLGLVGMLRRRS